MTRRVLPASEYGRLVGTPLERLAPYLPEISQVIVIEDDAGEIIGTWSAFPMWHLEGFWVAETHRQRGGVARSLLMGMRDVLADVQAKRVLTAADTDSMCAWLERLGAERLPGEHYVWPMEES